MRRLPFLLLFLFAAAASAPSQTFTMNEVFLRTIIDGGTIQPTFRVRVNTHGPLHQLASDCEMHVAGTVQGLSLGNPSPVIVEFPNWCEFSPQGQLGESFNELKGEWDDFAGSNLDGQNCDVTGFLRIFTEHADTGGGPTNPNHVYEYHPALSVACGSRNFSFANMLRAFPNLRHISPTAASNCISGRRLQVRFSHNRYEFQESGGGTCGNFAIVRVSALDMDWSFETGGGHYAFATVTADGHHAGQIGLYTLSGTDMDSWLSQAISSGGMGHSTKVIHGVFAYDWEAIIDTLTDAQGNLKRPGQWTEVDFPLALITYGETTAPF
jgi:hypothetical protein